MSKSLPGLPQPQGNKKLSTSDLIVMNAFTLADALGVSERDVAASCVKFAVTIAEKQGDPDGWLAILTRQAKDA